MNRSPVLIRLLDRRTRALKRHIPRAIAGDDVGVHQARVASRRLREAVPVLSEGLHGSKAGKAQRKIRKLTQALGTVRELDVALGLIDELDARQEVPKAALADVRAHVMSEREDRRRVMHERLEDVNREKLERRLQSVRDALAAPSPDHAWRSALAHRLVTGARRLDHAITKAGQIYAPEALHQVRIASKKLRYALEIANECRMPSAGCTIYRCCSITLRSLTPHRYRAARRAIPVWRSSRASSRTTAGCSTRGTSRSCRRCRRLRRAFAARSLCG
jgi:CHAD domain-containing protein